MDSITARFDDIRAGTALVFGLPERVVSAYRVDEVRDAMAEVDRATRDGAWAWGHVAYEAAPAFDPAMRVHDREADASPLMSFAIGDPPEHHAVVTSADPASLMAQAQSRPWQPDWDRGSYMERVGLVRDSIADGSVYQVNLTTRLRGSAGCDWTQLYAELAGAQGGAYNAYINMGLYPAQPRSLSPDPRTGPVVISASPELFFLWDDTGLTTRPMKGTAPRGADPDDDRTIRTALLTSDKERAENVMIVDLLRNDLSRLAKPGTVRVQSLLQAEQYRTLWQLTSTITAEPRIGTTLLDVFDALFPSGSVTGAPKVAAMSLIADLEDSPRGVYCGAIGVAAPPGSAFRARFSVPIRTVEVNPRTGTAVFGVGAGITWSSDAAREWDEVTTKAAILDRTRPVEMYLLETMRFTPEEGLRNLDRHLARLSASANDLGFTFDLGYVHGQVGSALASYVLSGPRRVRLMLSPSGRVVVEDEALVVTDDDQVLNLALDTRATVPGQWTRHKTTWRRPYEAAAARRPDADDVLMLNANGHLLEATRANVAVRLDGVWCTPPLAFGCLPGIERQRLVEARVMVERAVHVSELTADTELALVSSLRGWRAARLMGY